MPRKGLKRRGPGQRRRRSRRNDELEQVRVQLGQEAYEELLQLRSTHVQAYRKQLARYIRKGAIAKGRTYHLHDDDLALLDGDLQVLREVITEQVQTKACDYRKVNGLIQEEKTKRNRPAVLEFLEAMLSNWLDEDGRTIDVYSV